MAHEDRVKALLRLGAEDSEEGRTAAHQAARLIHRHGMIDKIFVSPFVAPAIAPQESAPAPQVYAPAPRPQVVPPNPYSRAYQQHVEKLAAEKKAEERAKAAREQEHERRVFSYASRIARVSRQG